MIVLGKERQEQEYNAYGLGWMCCGYVFGQALAHSQLKRLDSNNALRVQNCNFLTEHLSKIEGIEPPYVPLGHEKVYYNCVVGVNPKKLGLDLSPKILRDKIQRALTAEGMNVG